MKQYVSTAPSAVGRRRPPPPPPRPAGGTLPWQDSVAGGGNGSGGLMVTIQIRWGFEGYWMIQRFLGLGRKDAVVCRVYLFTGPFLSVSLFCI